MLQPALDGYGWTGKGIVEAMLTAVRGFVARYPNTGGWGQDELAYMERNADFFAQQLND
jgi:hypothetical protein